MHHHVEAIARDAQRDGPADAPAGAGHQHASIPVMPVHSPDRPSRRPVRTPRRWLSPILPRLPGCGRRTSPIHCHQQLAARLHAQPRTAGEAAARAAVAAAAEQEAQLRWPAGRTRAATGPGRDGLRHVLDADPCRHLVILDEQAGLGHHQFGLDGVLVPLRDALSRHMSWRCGTTSSIAYNVFIDAPVPARHCCRRRRTIAQHPPRRLRKARARCDQRQHRQCRVGHAVPPVRRQQLLRVLGQHDPAQRRLDGTRGTQRMAGQRRSNWPARGCPAPATRPGFPSHRCGRSRSHAGSHSPLRRRPSQHAAAPAAGRRWRPGLGSGADMWWASADSPHPPGIPGRVRG